MLICPECGSTSFEPTAFNHGLGKRREYNSRNLHVYDGDSILLSLRSIAPSTNCKDCGYVMGSSNKIVLNKEGTWFKADAIRFFYNCIAPSLPSRDLRVVRKKFIKAYNVNKRELHKKPFSEAMEILCSEV